MLVQAHAGELAAYHAYEGHYRSVSDHEQKVQINRIQREELDHLHEVSKMLHSLGAQPSVFKDLLYIIIGKTASFLCYITGWYLPMWGAKKIEAIGAASYWEIADMAMDTGHFQMSAKLCHMAETEEAHEKYFQQFVPDRVA